MIYNQKQFLKKIGSIIRSVPDSEKEVLDLIAYTKFYEGNKRAIYNAVYTKAMRIANTYIK